MKESAGLVTFPIPAVLSHCRRLQEWFNTPLILNTLPHLICHVLFFHLSHCKVELDGLVGWNGWWRFPISFAGLTGKQGGNKVGFLHLAGRKGVILWEKWHHCHMGPKMHLCIIEALVLLRPFGLFLPYGGYQIWICLPFKKLPILN